MSEPTHECPHPTCTRQVDVSKLACTAHWYMVPLDLRNDLWESYRRRRANPARHRAALAACIQWLRDHG